MGPDKFIHKALPATAIQPGLDHAILQASLALDFNMPLVIGFSTLN